MAHLEHSSTSTVELNFIEIVNGFQPLTIFGKSPITVRLGSKYVSVIINLIFTSTTQLYSKTTKINEIFIGNPQFFLKLVQKLRNNKSSSFGGPLWIHTKTNSCQIHHLHRLSGLYPMSLMNIKEFVCILSPGKKDPEKSTAAVDPRHLKVKVADKDFPNCPML